MFLSRAQDRTETSMVDMIDGVNRKQGFGAPMNTCHKTPEEPLESQLPFSGGVEVLLMMSG